MYTFNAHLYNYFRLGDRVVSSIKAAPKSIRALLYTYPLSTREEPVQSPDRYNAKKIAEIEFFLL